MVEDMELKICADCKYCRYEHDLDGYVVKCDHEKSVNDIDFTSGRKFFKKCEKMREGDCGKEAVLFEPKKAWWKIWT
jgi:hypothetical protein